MAAAPQLIVVSSWAGRAAIQDKLADHAHDSLDFGDLTFGRNAAG